jgi:hypothetical protein
LVTFAFLPMLVALSRCNPTLPPATDTPSPLAGDAYLRIEVEPQGAAVLVDGLASGRTPVELQLPAGRHSVRVEQDGYLPLIETVDLRAGAEFTLEGQLVQTATPAPPTVTLIPPPPTGETGPLPDLIVSNVKIELETGGSCDYTSTELGIRVWIENAGQADAGPFVVDVNGVRQDMAGLAAGETRSLWLPGYAFGAENAIVVDVDLQVPEIDDENNTFRQMVPIPTLPPTCTPPPEAPVTDTPTPSPPQPPPPPPPPPQTVTVREGQVTIPTYPYDTFLQEGWNETFNMPYAILDRDAYQAANPAPRQVSYRIVTVENEYLILTFLPELGGRLYEIIYKPTGHRETYRNPVLKPSPWGPPEQGWWLAAGGIEWCLPVEEHGYESAVPWQIDTEQSGGSATVRLRDSQAADRVRAEILVRLEAGTAAFTIRPRLENPTGAPLAVKYWTNAMLAPGAGNAPSADLRFVLPDAVTAVTVHSRGDDFLPAYDARMAWPIHAGRDLSRLGNWNRWLGFFADPAQGDFIAVYDEGHDEGLVRIFDARLVRGAKGFGFGWSDPIASDNWTDDGSSYVELHGGPAPTFDDSTSLPAGGHLQWSETWYPVAGLGGLRHANAAAALNLTAGNGQAQVAVAVPRPWSGDLVLLLDGQEEWRQTVTLLPGAAFRQAIPLGAAAPEAGRLTLRLEMSGGAVAAEYSADYRLR